MGVWGRKRGTRGSFGGNEGNRVKPRLRWEGNINMYHKEAKWGYWINWINLAEDKCRY